MNSIENVVINVVYIRVDANEIIGTGHAMRCLAIANEIRCQGEMVEFICADERTEKIVSEWNFNGTVLNSKWNDLENEIDALIALIVEKNIQLLLVDSYYVTELYLTKLREHTQIVYIDDLYTMLYPVDCLINYNFYGKDLGYETAYNKAGSSPVLLLGCEYAPLRKEFYGIKRTIKDIPQKILITSGGTDGLNVIENILSKLHEREWFDELEYYVILGRFNQNREELLQKWKNENIHFLINVPNMNEYMLNSDIAITAGGTTTYEICACGIPAIMYTIADNQLGIAKSVDEQELIPWAGDAREDMDICMENVVKNLERLKSDKSLRVRMSKKMRKSVDGKGCQRIAEQLILLEKGYSLM